MFDWQARSFLSHRYPCQKKSIDHANAAQSIAEPNPWRPNREMDSFECAVCGQTLESWNTTWVPSYRLIAGPVRDSE
jgi:hypothetical protein